MGGSGTFQQQIKHQDIVNVGEIPPGLEQVEIFLKSNKDVDIQLYDKNTGTKIVAWPDGLLHGASHQETTYRGVTIAYSGYNGYHDDWGKEYILIRNRTNRTLEMKAFGYQSGFAQVNYQWGTAWVEHKDAFVAPIRFSNGEPHRGWLESLFGVREAIVSEVPFKLAELLVGKGKVGRFFLGPLNHLLNVLDVIPAVGGSLEMENELLLVRDGEWIERGFGGYHLVENEPVTVVAITYAAGDFQSFPPIVTRFAKDLEIRKVPSLSWTRIPLLTEEEGERLSQYVVVPKQELRLVRGHYKLRWGNTDVTLIVDKQ